MTAEQFTAEVLDLMTAEKTLGERILRERYAENRVASAKILKVADISEGSRDPSEYLLGAEPEWRDVKHNRVAHRACVDEIVRQVDGIRSGANPRRFIIVTGTAGTGKSSAMMLAALRLEADGLPSGWLECLDRFEYHTVKAALEGDKTLGALFISNADLGGRRVSRWVRDALEINPRIAIVCECRSAKVDRIVDKIELGRIEAIEYTVPFLGDTDIDAILEVLDRENRLGLLKGLNASQRKRVFEAEAGRQMLVAMYKATHGEEFKNRAVTELNELDDMQKLIYGLVSVAHAHRFYLKREEIGIACGDDVDQWPRALNALSRRKLILGAGAENFKARHREIAQFIYDELITQGAIAGVIRALIKIGATQMHPTINRNCRAGKMLSSFINHTFMKRAAGVARGREIYAEFEQLLSWDYHYWLHRGALELESGNLGLAENFLLQSKSIEPLDIFVDNELAYLKLRKANDAPLATASEQLVAEALGMLESIADRRPDQRVRAYHIMGSQGLVWSQESRMSETEKQRFLGMLLGNLRSLTPDELDSESSKMIRILEQDLQRELLLAATGR
jgi:hypothetical protein